MSAANRFAVVLATAPDMKVARMLARRALSARLAACVNIVPRIESHYWWKGRLEKSAEALLVMKTRRERLDSLRELVVAEHPYDTAEFIAMAVDSGSRKYLDWIAASVGVPADAQSGRRASTQRRKGRGVAQSGVKPAD